MVSNQRPPVLASSCALRRPVVESAMRKTHLDYGDVIFHNERTDLMNLIEQVQYKAALIVSGCWQGTNREKLYDELGWESLSERRWCRRMTMFL